MTTLDCLRMAAIPWALTRPHWLAGKLWQQPGSGRLFFSWYLRVGQVNAHSGISQMEREAEDVKAWVTVT